jgi:hypothetical protein
LQPPFGSLLPFLTGAQAPSESARLQVSQVPLQRDPQQTPCAQNLLSHSLSLLQRLPGGLPPHTPLRQRLGETQSLLAVHEAAHLAPSHLNGAQLRAAAGAQAPFWQVLRGVQLLLPALQDWSPHTVPSAKRWHAPAPLQLPLVPQVLTAWTAQIFAGSVMPAATRGSG